MTKKNIKIIAKVFFMIIVVLLLIKIASMTFIESKHIEEKAIKTYEVSQEEIISSGNEILVKSFKKGIDVVFWISPTELLIEGTLGNETGQYVFDMIAKELIKYKGEEKSLEKDYGQYEFIKNIPNYGDLCIYESKIGLLTSSHEFKVVADNAMYNGEVKLILSDDLSKMLYYHHDNKSIVIYSFESDFYKTLKLEIEKSILDNFEKYVKLSPLGGYVSIETRNEVFMDSNFSIFGADSGKLYASDVMGVQLSWAPDDSKVCYYYTKETEKLEVSQSSDIDVISKRVGYYDVISKEIEYIDSTESEKNMVSQIYWSSDSERFSCLTGSQNENGNIVVDSALEFDFLKNSFNEITFKEPETAPIGARLELIDYDEAYILVVDSEISYKIMRILKDNAEIIEFEDLSMMKINNNELAYYYKESNALITANRDFITVTKPNFQGYIHLLGSDYVIYPSSNIDYLVVWFQSTNEIKILSAY